MEPCDMAHAPMLAWLEEKLRWSHVVTECYCALAEGSLQKCEGPMLRYRLGAEMDGARINN